MTEERGEIVVDKTEGQVNEPFGGLEWPRFTQIPNPLFDRFMKDLSPTAFKVLMCIAHHVMYHNRETGDAALSRKQIQEQTDLSYNTVKNGIDDCIEAGVVEMVESWSKKPALSGMYTLRFKPGEAPWDDRH